MVDQCVLGDLEDGPHGQKALPLSMLAFIPETLCQSLLINTGRHILQSHVSENPSSPLESMQLPLVAFSYHYREIVSICRTKLDLMNFTMQTCVFFFVIFQMGGAAWSKRVLCVLCRVDSLLSKSLPPNCSQT